MIPIDKTQTLRLGKLSVPAVGVGTWQWGETTYWGGRSKTQSVQDAEGAYLESRAEGLSFFDTAEYYSNGFSESLLGRFINEHHERSDVVIATKFWTPFRLSARALPRALERSLDRLGVGVVDLYQIHWPVPWMRIEDQMDAMADMVRAGRIRMIGVSNFSAQQMRRAVKQLEKHRLKLTSNQVEYNLLKRDVETNGVLEFCRNLDIRLIAYSPLAQGVLTGKYHRLEGQPLTRPGGLRRFMRGFSAGQLARSANLIHVLQEIGAARGKSAAQVALNWLVMRGTLPIPGARNAEQAGHNAGALGWRLSQGEFEWIDHVSAGRSKPISTSWNPEVS
jgi:aryl-alcohol dehydrogenase-like predicted oxidoreductase